MDYPWYKTLNSNDELQQGDFIPDCPIFISPAGLSKDDEIEMTVNLMDVIILSQSCDLVNKEIINILVCPYSKATDYLRTIPLEQTKTAKARKKILDNIRKGYLNSYHLLNKQNGIFDDYLVVDFKNVYSIHRVSLSDTIERLENRVRLLPPYREHLSQAFARYFMRVGLPQDIYIEGY